MTAGNVSSTEAKLHLAYASKNKADEANGNRVLVLSHFNSSFDRAVLFKNVEKQNHSQQTVEKVSINSRSPTK